MKYLALDEYKDLNYDELVSQIARDYAVEEDVVEKYNVLVASYECADYEGNGYLFLQEKETSKYFEVHSCHCSCYGLEGQLEPEVVELKYIFSKHYNARGNEQLVREFLVSTLRKYKIDEILGN